MERVCFSYNFTILKMAKSKTKLLKNKKSVFKCDKCGESFKRNQNLIQHLRCMHKKKVKKFVCPACSVKKQLLYSNEGNLKVHVGKHHSKKWKELVQKMKLKFIYVNKRSEYAFEKCISVISVFMRMILFCFFVVMIVNYVKNYNGYDDDTSTHDTDDSQNGDDTDDTDDGDENDTRNENSQSNNDNYKTSDDEPLSSLFPQTVSAIQRKKNLSFTCKTTQIFNIFFLPSC